MPLTRAETKSKPRAAAPATVPVMLPLALPGAYDYLPPDGRRLEPGQFVVAPLGPVEYLAVVWTLGEGEAPRDIERKKLREIVEVIDDVPRLPRVNLAFADWVANYTLSSPGMVLRMMMSASRAFDPPAPRYGVRLVGSPPQRVTPARARVIEAASNGMIWVKASLAEAAGVSSGVIDGLIDAGTLIAEPLPDWHALPLDLARERATLTPEQKDAAGEVLANTSGGFAVTLLDGVTGSGKTEVYFEAIAQALAKGKQALVLMPEIALTAQFIARCEERFGARPAEWHSGVPAPQRGRVWRAVIENKAKLVVGARSALFLPFPDLGLIVVDEEHDAGYKQEERVAYQARDMAVVRGRLGGCPVVLSSATPSIESLVNASQGRYRHVQLATRYKADGLPALTAIDMRANPPERGKWLSPVLVEAIAETLARGEQALLFLNRRGYAPVTLCRKCGFKFECPNCSAWLVEHRFRRRLECHHCGTFIPIPDKCPHCEAENALVPCGPGVERIAEEVAERFPEARRVLLSSDLTPNIAELRHTLREIEEREVDIVIGTQLVAKSHHFPGLALVGVVDGDLGLAQADPRAAERTFQLLSQVTGRAGREAIKGRGLIQTYMPEHPVIAALVSGDRDTFLAREIEARREARMPPFGRLAALLVSASSREAAEGYAREVARNAPAAAKIEVLGPAEAPLSVIRGRHRFRLLVKAAREADLQAYLRLWLSAVPKAKGDIRLTVDVDPYSFL
ncbi:primosomal protein N' [Methyloceanibacter sp.]|uniref:primosomal protein N' n=1 Tax=Methyloceanibacter sp. TaxID=1965321 RepID=UPI002D361886|nr:primosomal protein N' [Methyloceanibacter sp.]HZP08247.1 primosomal protein N' [Methyloceanibacter sp.]